MLRRFDYKNRRKVRQITDRAAQKAAVPGAPSLGATPGPRHTTGVYVTPDINGTDYVDETGVLKRGFVLGVDKLNDPNRFLIVRGVKKKYYG